MSKTQHGASPRPEPDSTDRAMIARIAAHTSWANTPDRSARTAPGRAAALAAMFDKFERQVDPDGTMPPQERTRAAESARKAYFQQLARRSRKSRQRAAQARAQALQLDRDAELADSELADAELTGGDAA